MPNTTMTLEQAAGALQTDERTIRRWLMEGRLGGHPTGGFDWWVEAESVLRLAADPSYGQSQEPKAYGQLATKLLIDQVDALTGQVNDLTEENGECHQVVEQQAQAIRGLIGQVKGLGEEVKRLQAQLTPSKKPGWWARVVRPEGGRRRRARYTVRW